MIELAQAARDLADSVNGNPSHIVLYYDLDGQETGRSRPTGWHYINPDDTPEGMGIQGRYGGLAPAMSFREAQRYMSAYRAYPDDEEARNIQLEVQR